MIESTKSDAATCTVPKPTPEEAAQLEQLCRDFEAGNLIPLWTEIADLIPMVPSPKAVPHVWRWDDLYPLAARAGDLMAVGRGGERRAIVGQPWPGRPAGMPRRRCGLPSSIWARTKQPRSTATRQPAQVLPDLRTAEGRLFFADTTAPMHRRNTKNGRATAGHVFSGGIMTNTAEYKSSSVALGSWEPLIDDGQEIGEVHWLREGEGGPVAGLWRIGTEEGAEVPYNVHGTDSFYVIEGEAELETPDGENIMLVTGGVYSFPDGFAATWRTR